MFRLLILVLQIHQAYLLPGNLSEIEKDSLKEELPSITKSHDHLPACINEPLKRIINNDHYFKEDMARSSMESYLFTILFMCTMKNVVTMV